MELQNSLALHEASKDGDVHTVNKLLLNSNTSQYLVNMEDPYHCFTPVHWAAYNGHFECLRLLISFEPSSINVQTSNFFQTPLHLAAQFGHAQCVLLLLQAGVNPEVKDSYGETALHKAAKSGKTECVCFLMSAMSNIGVQNAIGQTASVMAEINGFPTLASLIRQREVQAINVFHNGNVTTGSLTVGPRLNRKRTRDMCDLDYQFKRQRSRDVDDIPLPSNLPANGLNSVNSSVMEHQDLCGSEMNYANTLLDCMIQDYHGC